MGNLKDRQRAMRERNATLNKSRATVTQSNPASQTEVSSEVHVLKKQISELEKRLLVLEAENRKLEKLKTIVEDRAPERSRSSDNSVREQRHNFFKYSNVRKY